MSIQPFAQSLLSDVRKRRQEEEKRLRKQRERQELLGLGVGLAVKIGNEALANKTANFLEKEPVWNATQTQKLARKNAASFYNIQSSVDASGGDARSWAAKNMMPEFEARAEEILADEYTGAAGSKENSLQKRGAPVKGSSPSPETCENTTLYENKENSKVASEKLNELRSIIKRLSEFEKNLSIHDKAISA